MLRNYLRLAVRHYRRQVKTAALYVTGLTLGIVCAFVVFLAVTHEKSYDTHQTKRQRIYRAETEHFKDGFTTPGTYGELAKTIRREIPQIEAVSLILHKWGQRLTIPNADADFRETVYFADKTLIDVLDQRWVAGDAKTALSQPNSVVLTRSFARKFFGTEAVIGRTILYESKQPLLVTGVIDDYPIKTNFPLDVLISQTTLKSVQPDYDTYGWSGYGDDSQVYVVLKDNVQPTQLIKPLQAVVTKYMDKKAAEGQRFVLNPLHELHYTSNYTGRSADKKLLNILMLIGLTVLLIACINFVNLTTAQAFKRAKEVGVRKTIGSNRRNLAYQFLTEAGLITLVAILLSVVIVWLGLPLVSNLLKIPLSNTDLFTWQASAFLLTLFVSTTLLAGAYPAFYLSGMAPITTLKPIRSGNSRGVLRQGLVVFQFTVSLILISSALLIHRQLSFFQEADLGFDKNAVVTVGVPDNKPQKLQSLRSQLLESSQLNEVSFSLNSPSSDGNWMENVQYRKLTKAVDVRTQMKFADAFYLKTYDITLLAGQDFREGDTLTKAIINEVFLRRIGLQRPESALGQTVYLGQQAVTIIGVAKNFNVNSLHQSIDPTLIVYNPRNFHQSSIKLGGDKLTAQTIHTALEHIERAWTATFPNQPFEYKFLDETLAKAYQNETQTAALIDTATLIAILIACLGLFGLAAFTAEQRTKEIGVRKVLGASVASIVALLSKDFLKLVLIAIVIASPIAWYAMNRWLQDFAYKIDIEWWVFALAGLLAVGIALLTVSFQSIKAALMNPVKSLRSE